jgi:hypothetical protein
MDPTSETSKIKLYLYYRNIAYVNNWTVLTIPAFFEILNATFPSLRHNDNQTTGIKLVVTIRQQLQMNKVFIFSRHFFEAKDTKKSSKSHKSYGYQVSSYYPFIKYFQYIKFF